MGGIQIPVHLGEQGRFEVFVRVLYMFGNQTEAHFLVIMLNFDKQMGENSDIFRFEEREVT